MLAGEDQVIVAASADKLRSAAPFPVAPLDRVTDLVVDGPLPEPFGEMAASVVETA